MKWFKYIVLPMFFGLMVVALSGCGGGSDSSDTPPSGGVEALVILPKNATLPIGVNIQYRALAGSTDGNAKNVTAEAQWASSNPQVASVNESGIVTTVGEGSAVISASYGGKTANAEVTVKKETTSQLIAIELKFKNGSTSVEVPAGTEGQLIPIALMNDGTSFDATEWVSFSSNNPAIVKVDTRKGYAYAVAPGSAVLTAQYGGIVSNPVSVTVTPSEIGDPIVNPPVGDNPGTNPNPPAKLESITIEPNRVNLPEGEYVSFEAFGLFSDGKVENITMNKYVKWREEGSAVSIIKDGIDGVVVVGDKEGTASVIADATSYGPGFVAEAVVTVTKRQNVAPSIEVSVNPTTYNCATESSQLITITANASDQDGDELTYAWSATVNGKSLPLKDGGAPNIKTVNAKLEICTLPCATTQCTVEYTVSVTDGKGGETVAKRTSIVVSGEASPK
jgi:hypothetical protein